MTKDEAAQLAAGKDDEALAALCAKHGPAVLACAHEGLDGSVAHKSDEFSRSNPYVHFAIRAGVVEAVTKEIPYPEAARLNYEAPRSEHADNLPVTSTVFKGETPSLNG